MNSIDLSIGYVFKCQTMSKEEKEKKFIKKHYFIFRFFIYSFTLVKEM